MKMNETNILITKRIFELKISRTG